MKKKLVMTVLCTCLFSLAGCGSNVTEATSTAVETAEGAVTLSNEGEETTDAGDVEAVEGEDTTTEGAVETTTDGGYIFIYNGSEIAVGMLMSDIKAMIGDENAVMEAQSCAFDGLSRQYTYGSVEFVTYEDGDKEICCAIYLNDDMVNTAEGLRLNMTKQEMEDIYGTQYKEDGGIFTYEKGGMELRCTMGQDINGNDIVVFIEYSLPNPQ